MKTLLKFLIIAAIFGTGWGVLYLFFAAVT